MEKRVVASLRLEADMGDSDWTNGEGGRDEGDICERKGDGGVLGDTGRVGAAGFCCCESEAVAVGRRLLAGGFHT